MKHRHQAAIDCNRSGELSGVFEAFGQAQAVLDGMLVDVMKASEGFGFLISM